MRLPDSLRWLAWAALMALAAVVLTPDARPGVRALESVPSIRALARLATVPPADTLVVPFRGVPPDSVRGAVAALVGAGTTVRWRDEGVPGLAVEAEQDASTGRGILRAAGGIPEAADAAGPLGRVEGALAVAGLADRVRAGARPSVEVVPPRDAVVFGMAGWESRFVVRGLEQAGWTVTSVLRLAPDRVMPAPRLDTATTGVVIVLDSVDAVTARSVRAFVTSGGGLVLAPRALAAPSLAAWAPAALGPVERPAASLALPASRQALPHRPLLRAREDAVMLEAGRVAARVEGRGRVLLLGDVETWRWAMASDAGRTDHAAFWSRVAEAARYRPLGDRVAGDPAPRAALVAAFGAPMANPPAPDATLPWETILFGAVLALLLAEWTLRRMAGKV